MKLLIPLLFGCLLTSSLQAGTLRGRVTESADGIVVSVKGVKGDFRPSKKDFIINQKNMRFVPNILPVLVGATVGFPNHELVIYHNIFSVSPGNEFDLGTYRTGTTKSVTLHRTGIVEILCNIHVRMYAVVIVLDNPYFTMVEADRNYEIYDIPAGEYTVETYLIKNKKVIRRQSKVVVPEQGIVELNFDLN